MVVTLFLPPEIVPGRGWAQRGSAFSGPVVCGSCFMQERFHAPSPGDLGTTFIKAEDGETKEGLKVEEATGGAALSF